MSNEKDIIISINGQTHQFKQHDSEAILKLPWAERKQLIALLEKIKQAEYIKSEASPKTKAAKMVTANKNDGSIPTAITPQSTNQSLTKKTLVDLNAQPPLDPAIKPSEADVDDLMNRLIVEQKQTHSSVPDKSVVYKWLLLIVTVLIVISVIF